MTNIHLIQEKLLRLSRKKNLAALSLREMGRMIGMPKESPQKIKHHLLQLEKKGFLSINREKGKMSRISNTPSWAKGVLTNSENLFSIPIIGIANCGEANIFAEENFRGFLKVSSKLVGRKKPNGLYAIKTSGGSMNKAEVNGKKIEDGDFVILDKNLKTPISQDIVLVVIDNCATIKRFIMDRRNNQIVLRADSSFDYSPIYLHSEDNFFINGKVIGVIKK